MTPAQIAAISSLRAEGLTHKAIAARVGCSHKTVAYHLKEAAREARLYPLDKITTLPLVTDSGTMWFMPIRPPDHFGKSGDCCAHCPLEQQCRERMMAGDYIACERPLRWEVVE